MPRIADAFARMRDERRVGLVTYVTARRPLIERTADILRALDRAGADLIELGVPFSDPLADGPIIQRACERALAGAATLGRVLDLVEEVRPSVGAPIVIFSYANPLYRMGYERFAARAASAGADGVLALDLPVEEAGPLREALLRHALDPIYLLSPTTSLERVRAASERGSGFLYPISRAGVTGARDEPRGRAPGPGQPRPGGEQPAAGRRVRAVAARARSSGRPASRTPPWSAARWSR